MGKKAAAAAPAPPSGSKKEAAKNAKEEAKNKRKRVEKESKWMKDVRKFTDRPEIVGNAVSIAVTLMADIWIYWVLEKYAVSWPRAIWNGEHIPLNSGCSGLFRVSTLSLWLLPGSLCSHAAILFGSYLSASMNMAMRCVLLIGMLAGWARLATTVGGIAAVVITDEEQRLECQSLYRCSWWCYVVYTFFRLGMRMVSSIIYLRRQASRVR
mmetsp:Transcript_51618/g.122847  ORF Transcript_51618/g.122847 Transcript_51618/m.122847 type:complete len:211 (-) Transcript_51618:169-801(-)